MLVNFLEIQQIAFLVMNGEVLVINDIAVDEFTFGFFISNTFDA